MRLYLSHVWKRLQDEMADEKTFTKKAHTFFGFISIRINAVSCILYKIVAEIVKTEEPALRDIESHAEMVTFVNGNPAIFFTYITKRLFGSK